MLAPPKVLSISSASCGLDYFIISLQNLHGALCCVNLNDKLCDSVKGHLLRTYYVLCRALEIEMREIKLSQPTEGSQQSELSYIIQTMSFQNVKSYLPLLAHASDSSVTTCLESWCPQLRAHGRSFLTQQ